MYVKSNFNPGRSLWVVEENFVPTIAMEVSSRKRRSSVKKDGRHEKNTAKMAMKVLQNSKKSGEGTKNCKRTKWK